MTNFIIGITLKSTYLVEHNWEYTQLCTRSPRKSYRVAQKGSERLAFTAWDVELSHVAPCQEFGLLSHGIFQDDFRCLIGSLVVKLHRNAHFIVVGMGPTTINCWIELPTALTEPLHSSARGQQSACRMLSRTAAPCTSEFLFDSKNYLEPAPQCARVWRVPRQARLSVCVVCVCAWLLE